MNPLAIIIVTGSLFVSKEPLLPQAVLQVQNYKIENDIAGILIVDNNNNNETIESETNLFVNEIRLKSLLILLQKSSKERPPI